MPEFTLVPFKHNEITKVWKLQAFTVVNYFLFCGR